MPTYKTSASVRMPEILMNFAQHASWTKSTASTTINRRTYISSIQHYYVSEYCLTTVEALPLNVTGGKTSAHSEENCLKLQKIPPTTNKIQLRYGCSAFVLVSSHIEKGARPFMYHNDVGEGHIRILQLTHTKYKISLKAEPFTKFRHHPCKYLISKRYAS